MPEKGAKLKNIIRAIYGATWAIQIEKMTAILDFVELRAEGARLTKQQIQASIGSARPKELQMRGTIAIMPLFGVMAHRMGMLDDISGGTSTESFGKTFGELMDDPEVTAIILDVDSPGGSVEGVEELAAQIFDARGRKPVVAVANATAASAAYWVASQADELVVTPSGEVGSIGVFSLHTDQSEADARAGLARTIISAGEFKTEWSPFEPLSDEALAAEQARVDHYYGMFLEAVGRGRGVGWDDVAERFGQGRMVVAAEAVALGMADRVATLSQVISDLQEGRTKETPTATSGRDTHSTSGANAATQMRKETDMPIADLSLSDLKAERPDLVTALRTEVEEEIEISGFAEEIAAEHKAAIVAAIKAEQARAAGIFADAVAIAGDRATPEAKLEFAEIGKELIARGTSLAEAKIELRDRKLKAIQAAAPDSPGPDGDPETQFVGAGKGPKTEEQLKEEYAKSEKLQAQYETADIYLAYLRGTGAGRIKELSKRE